MCNPATAYIREVQTRDIPVSIRTITTCCISPVQHNIMHLSHNISYVIALICLRLRFYIYLSVHVF